MKNCIYINIFEFLLKDFYFFLFFWESQKENEKRTFINVQKWKTERLSRKTRKKSSVGNNTKHS